MGVEVTTFEGHTPDLPYMMIHEVTGAIILRTSEKRVVGLKSGTGAGAVLQFGNDYIFDSMKGYKVYRGELTLKNN